MAMLPGTCEIEELGTGLRTDKKAVNNWMSRQGRVYSIEDDLNQLFRAIEVKTSVRRDVPRKNPMKRPARASSSQSSGIGITEPVNLKQALRGLCISQASEMAAMRRRSLKAAGLSGASDMGIMKRFYRAVIAEANDSGLPLNDGKGNLVEISLPTKVMSDFPGEIPEFVEVFGPGSSKEGRQSNPSVEATTPRTKIIRSPLHDKILSFPSKGGNGLTDKGFEQREKFKKAPSLQGMYTIAEVLGGANTDPSRVDVLSKSVEQGQQQNEKLCPTSCPSSGSGKKTNKSSSSSLRLINPIFRNKYFVKRKLKVDSTLASSCSNLSGGNKNSDFCLSMSKLTYQAGRIACKDESKSNDNTSSTLSSQNSGLEVSSIAVDSSVSQVVTLEASDAATNVVAKTGGRLRQKEKGEISQSSKSSIGEYSSSTSVSGDSSLSGSSRCGNRPHMSKDVRYEAVCGVLKQHGSLSLRHFNLLRKLGSGDIGTVYLAELANTNCLFALKVLDNEFLARMNKFPRAETEREILQMLDHPFLPTLYAHFTSDRFSCLLMEYCAGGDLHVLRQKQPNGCFSEQAAKFYVAEVLLALEYLHMLGVVYRDLKPENILVREDGHIMLSDFDLSLRCVVNPTLLRSSSPVMEPTKRTSSSCPEPGCIDPFCLQSSWQVSCFSPRLPAAAAKPRKLKPDQAAQVIPLPQLVVEPKGARSNSFVGTHEYLAPEIIKGEGHGSAVDWWTFGVFLYELLYGKTPFKGSSKDATLTNVVSQPLKFPASPIVSFHARDLIRQLLITEPENRLGFGKGAAVIKQHPFFEGMNWALIRCAIPPERPILCNLGLRCAPTTDSGKKDEDKSRVSSRGRENIKFELF
ncbi:hypothetical protein Nepgr_014497 [Nepenthes gracilis]|uniref:non-specific serine/threonine protein kinase n=1 Tax=Nepenthes gracilis TaxID=150966 RepID=A0AAD3SLY5_NEPGR|nr:hypothetical protein Nepgr_014497 [Nepenthes gracilis]